MPTDPQIPSSSSRMPRQAEKAPRWFPWTSLMLVTGIFLGFYAYWEAPTEIGRWHLAAANEYWIDAEIAAIKGNSSLAAELREKSIAKVEDALKWSPAESSFLLKRAQLLFAMGKDQEALEECNSLIAKFGELGELLSLRMSIYQNLGRHADAVKDAEQVNAISETSGNPSRGDALNNLAYLRAVGKIGLQTALVEAEESVEYAGKDSQKEPLDFEAKHTLAMRQDTRGFVRFQLGDYARAIEDLEAAVQNIDDVLQHHTEVSPLVKRVSPDARPATILFAKLQKEAAVIIYHRALVHERLGHAAAAAADRKRVRELIGRDGDEKLF
jgi:tetratricopeptide (TPR) repeat protein